MLDRERERGFHLLANKEYFRLTPSCGRGLRYSAILRVIGWLLVAYAFQNIRLLSANIHRLITQKNVGLYEQLTK